MILLVEDNQPFRQAAQEALEQAGFSVVSVGDAETALETALEMALELAQKQPVDVLITDLHLPGMNGDELARRLLARAPALPILIMTSHVEDPAARIGGAAIEWLKKPFALDRLVEAARRLQDDAWLSSSIRTFQAIPPAKDAPAIPRPISVSAVDSWTWSRLWPFALGLLAIVGVTLLSLRALSLPDHDRSSGVASTIERNRSIAGLRPEGPIAAAPEQLQWQPLSQARRYRITLKGVDQRSIFVEETGESLITLPSQVAAALKPSVSYTWSVEAFDQVGAQVGSSSTRFRIIVQSTFPASGMTP